MAGRYRRNGDLADRMREGDPNAWLDPAADLEVISDPSIVEGIRIAALQMNNRRRQWPQSHLRLVAMAGQNWWTSTENVFSQIRYLASVAKADGRGCETHRGMCQVYLEVIKPYLAPMPEEYRWLAGALMDYAEGRPGSDIGDIRRAVYRHKGGWKDEDSAVMGGAVVQVSHFFDNLDSCESPGLQMQSVTGTKVIQDGIMRRFPDFLIWVPAGMSRNRSGSRRKSWP